MKYSKEKLVSICDNLKNAFEALDYLKKAHSLASVASDFKNKATLYKDNVIPAMESLRFYCDTLEGLLPKEEWPFPDYTDLMYRV